MFNGNTSQDFAALDAAIDGTVYQLTARPFIAQTLVDFFKFYTETFGDDAEGQYRATTNSLQMFIESLTEEREYLLKIVTDATTHLRAQSARRGVKYAKARIDAKTRKNVLERDAYRCRICSDWKDLTVDHIFPEVLGGTLHHTNLRTLCRKCNSRKGARYARPSYASVAD